MGATLPNDLRASGLLCQRSLGALVLVVAALDERNAGQASEAKHADAQPDEPEAGQSRGHESTAAQPPRTAIVVGDEDRALERLNVGCSLDYRHPIDLRP